jgi:chromosome segregation ATPase
LVAERARVLGGFTTAAIQRNCSEAIQAEINKLSAENAGMRRKIKKSANSLIAKSALAQQSAQEKLNDCIREAQKVREETRIDFQGKIDDLQHQYDSIQKEINEIQSALTLMDAQRAQAKSEQEQNKTQIMQERVSNLMSLQQELQSNTQITQQRIMQLQQQLRQAQMDLSKASNELATADQRPDGKFDISMAIVHADQILKIEGLLRSNSCPGYEKQENNSNSSQGAQ